MPASKAERQAAEKAKWEIQAKKRKKSRQKKKRAITKKRDAPPPNPKHLPSRMTSFWDDEALRPLTAEISTSIGFPIPVNLSLYGTPDIAPADFDKCVSIVQHTSKNDYESSSIGWDIASKRKELHDPNMMFMIVRPGAGIEETFAPGLPIDIIAFIAFVITNDDPPHQDRDVVYVWEVHIGDNFRGLGLGKSLMSIVETMARKADITKSMLTVFKSNAAAIKAYTRMGYTKDQASPPDREIRGRVIETADYMIMSKTLPPLPLESQLSLLSVA